MFDPDDLGALYAGEPIQVYIGKFTNYYQISRYCGWLTDRGTFSTNTDQQCYNNAKIMLDHVLKPNMRDRTKQVFSLKLLDFE